MVDGASSLLCDPVLIDLGIEHGFGQRNSETPENTYFSRQVHGIDVFEVGPEGAEDPAAADALVTTRPGRRIGIVTADCVPILVASIDGQAVAAIHAGWRGLAAGVIEAGLAAIRARSGHAELVAAVGPAARGCCYEVDEPVRRALVEHHADRLEGVLVPGRPHRFQLDLPRLATRVLFDQGISLDRIGLQNRVCTICDPSRFHSFRRDGVDSGRLSHFVMRPERLAGQG